MIQINYLMTFEIVCFKETKFAGVYAYSFEKEAVSTEIQLTGPATLKITNY